MKLTYYQLEKQLENKLLPAYIVSGDEIILKEESIGLIRQKAKERGFCERSRLIAETNFDWDKLYNQLHSASLFAIKRIIELDLTHSSLNKVACEILQLYGNAPHPDTLLIINTGKMDTKTLKTNWCSTLEKIGALVTIWPITLENLPQWIMRRAKHHQLTLNLNSARLLANYVEGNLIAAANAIEKLFLLGANKPIDEELIESIMVDDSHYSIFDFAENWINGNVDRSLHILEQLKRDNTEPVLILWSLTREIRVAIELAKCLQAGSRLEDLLQKQRIFFKRASALRHFLNKFSIKDCWTFLNKAGEIDKIIKGAKEGSPWDALQLFCLRTLK